MLIFIGILAAAAVGGAVRAVRDTVARLPASNRDWFFY